MAEDEIASIFIEIVANDLRYCSMCFRTERERQLVVPECYTKCMFLHPLRLERQAWWVCALCEGLARRALLVLDAITFTSCARGWLRAATDRRRTCDLPFFIARASRNMTFGGLSLAGFWRRLRARTQLRQTEMLLVAAGGQDGDVDTIQLDEKTLSAPVASPPDMQGEPELENVLIIDDEDPLQCDVSNTVYIESTPTPDQTILLENTNQIVLHPAHQTPEGNWYIPSLTVLSNATHDIPTMTRGPALDINGVYSKGDDNLTQLIISPEITSPGITSSNIISPNIANPYVTEMPLLVESVRSSKKGKRLHKSERTDKPVKSRPGEVQPIVTNHRVDWEDKIPMDVISFVDASDPSTQQFLASPPPSNGSDTDRQKDRCKILDEVVDLC